MIKTDFHEQNLLAVIDSLFFTFKRSKLIHLNRKLSPEYTGYSSGNNLLALMLLELLEYLCNRYLLPLKLYFENRLCKTCAFRSWWVLQMSLQVMNIFSKTKSAIFVSLVHLLPPKHLTIRNLFIFTTTGVVPYGG